MNRGSRVPRRAEAGFTLIEALVAVIVLSFGLIAVTNLMLVAASSNTVANQGTAAAAIATEEMERLKALPFTDPQLAAGGSVEEDTPADCIEDPDDPADPADPVVLAYCRDTNVPGVGMVHVRWSIEDIVAARGALIENPAGVKFITVRAEGRGALTGARSRSEFTTFRTENPDPAATPAS